MFKTLLATTAAAASASAALAPIVRKGAFLFNSQTNDRFFIKGVDYAASYGTSQTKPADPISALDVLANVEGCKRDVPFLKDLGVNVVRVYQVNSTLDHSQCMTLLDQAGIYVLADLATPMDAISGNAPHWNLDIFQHYIETVAELGQYTNALGFSVGNEVLNGPTDAPAAPYLKAAIRDVKSWMNNHGYPQIVGYAATDKPESRVNLPHYFACAEAGVDESTIADFWGINMYEWCSPSTFETSGYRARTDELKDLGIVSFLTENGCGTIGTRPFDDTGVILGPNMDQTWSGTFAFEFINEGNNFGIVSLSADGSTITPSSDFANYKAEIAKAAPTSIKLNDYKPTVKLPLSTCPAQDATNWNVASTLPPTPNAALCECAASASVCHGTPTAVADLGKTFGVVCGQAPDLCKSLIGGDGTAAGGKYGTYSMCAPEQQLSIVLGAYRDAQGGAVDSCDFGGLAQLQGSGASGSYSATLDQCVSKNGFVNGVGVPLPSSAITDAKPPTSTGNPSTGGGGSTGGNGGSKPNDGNNGAATVAVPVVALFAALLAPFVL